MDTGKQLSKLASSDVYYQSRDPSWNCPMWPDLRKSATYAHNDKEWFSSPINSSINILSNYHNTTAKGSLVCFLWGLFLRPVRRPRVLGWPLNATGWLVQAATLLEITNWLVDDIGHGFSYILWHFECNGTLFYPYRSACGVGKKLSKMAGNSASCALYSV